MRACIQVKRTAMMPASLFILTLCHTSSVAAVDIDIADAFGQTIETKILESFWHSTGFTAPTSEPEESAEFLLSRGLSDPFK